MKKITTLSAMFVLFMTNIALSSSPAEVNEFDLVSYTDSTATIHIKITLPDSGYYYVLRSEGTLYNNLQVSVHGTPISGHGIPQHFSFLDDSLILGIDYIYMVVAVCDYTTPNTRDSSFLTVNTAPLPAINNLLGDFTQTNPIQLTVDYMAHSYATTISLIRMSDGITIAVHYNLVGTGIQTDTFNIIQTNPTETYTAVAWDVYHSSVAYSSNSFTVTLQGTVSQPPTVDSVWISSMTANGFYCHLSWNSDGLPGTFYLYSLCGGVFPGNIATIFSVPPGIGDTVIYVSFSCPSSTTVGVAGILENAHNGLDRDTLISVYNILPTGTTPGSLVPYAVWIDQSGLSALIRIDSISVQSPNAFIQMEAIDVDTIHNGAYSFVIPVNGPIVNASVTRVFHGAPGVCYYFRSVLVDGNTITQSWFAQSTPVCFNGVTEIEEADVDYNGWNKGYLNLRPKDFPTTVTTTDMLGRVIASAYYGSWEQLYFSLPEFSGIVIISALDQKTGLQRIARLSKVH
ncbi:MAG: hypothetical protein RL641_800 [Candidatus Parcubacteria bacterium]|jgi:hypothetical protein